MRVALAINAVMLLAGVPGGVPAGRGEPSVSSAFGSTALPAGGWH
jgi:hypothetical protein